MNMNRDKKRIDCLLIGHNEMKFETYENNIRRMGIQSGAYRDLDLNFVKYNHKSYYLSEVFNLFCRDKRLPEGFHPFKMRKTGWRKN